MRQDCYRCWIKHEISKLRGSGLSQKEIAERLNVTQQVVSYNLKLMKKEYLEGCLE